MIDRTRNVFPAVFYYARTFSNGPVYRFSLFRIGFVRIYIFAPLTYSVKTFSKPRARKKGARGNRLQREGIVILPIQRALHVRVVAKDESNVKYE